MDQNGIWLSIVDYSKYRDISISTIRRYIKANRVNYKKVDGKFLIHVTDENYQKNTARVELASHFEIERLKMRLKELEEENNDLRMLVDLYEGKKRKTNLSLPELPLS